MEQKGNKDVSLTENRAAGMDLNDEEREEFELAMANPYFRGVVENAPHEACREYIVNGLIYGFFAGYDPDICRESLEDGLTADDWKYVKRHLAGHDPFLLKCVTRIRELEDGDSGKDRGEKAER